MIDPFTQRNLCEDVSNLQELLLELLPNDGSAIGNKSALKALSHAAQRCISEHEYNSVKVHLYRSGLIKKGRGRGGAIAKICEPKSNTLQILDHEVQIPQQAKNKITNKYVNHSSWKTRLDTPCCLLMPCTECKELLPVIDFYQLRNHARKDILGIGRQAVCRRCNISKYINIDLKTKLLYAARQRANGTGVPFALSTENILIPDRCPILGIQIWEDKGGGSRGGSLNDNAPSIDKVDPKKGYTPSNICVISKRANRVKNNGDIDEFLAVLTYIVASDTRRKRSIPTPYIYNPVISKESLLKAALLYLS